MRILTISNLYPPDVVGGYEIACRQAVEALLERGHDVQVLTTPGRSPSPRVAHVDRALRLTDPFSQFVNRLSTLSTIRLMDSGSYRLDAFNVDRTFEALERFQPDVVYLWNLLGIGGLGLLAALKHRRVPWVWHLMDNVPSYLCRWNSLGPNRLIAEVARQLRGRYIACSRRVVDEIERDGIPLLPEVELIPNWAGGPPGSDRSSRASSGRLRIISAGRITPEKGVGVLIESARVLRDRGIESFEIDIFGRLLDHEYPALVHRYGLEGWVSFKGELPNAELVKRYADYDVFAFPTWEREPFGIAPLEAALHGCVPIISRLCGISEWLVDGVHCLKADRTPEAFADRFQTVIDRTVDLGPIAARAQRVVSREFRVEAVIPRIEAILERASRESRAGAGSTEEFHRLAIIAERLARIIVQEGCAA